MGWLGKKHTVDFPQGLCPTEPWGTHLCHFYKTKEELIREVALFLARGLETGQAGLWILTESLFSIEDARRELGKLVPGLEKLEHEGGVTFTTHEAWYLAGGRFDMKALIRKAGRAAARARRLGFSGLRATGDLSWASEELWSQVKTDVMRYEKQIHDALQKVRVVALCTYPLERCTPSDIMEVLQSHTTVLTEHPAPI